MTTQPFLDAPWYIQMHAIAAIEVLILGIILLSLRKGGRLHRFLGYIWVFNMLLAAGTSFFIVSAMQMIGPYSFIHLLSVWAIYVVIRAVRQARQGDIIGHRASMRGLYLGGVVVASVLAFMPGRIFNRMLFEPIGENLGFGIVAALAIIASLLWRRREIKNMLRLSQAR